MITFSEQRTEAFIRIYLFGHVSAHFMRQLPEELSGPLAAKCSAMLASYDACVRLGKLEAMSWYTSGSTDERSRVIFIRRGSIIKEILSLMVTEATGPPFRPRTASPAALSATEMRKGFIMRQWTVPPERSLSVSLPRTHERRHTWLESGSGCESWNPPWDFINPCFCMNGQPLRSCFQLSLITGFRHHSEPDPPQDPRVF